MARGFISLNAHEERHSLGAAVSGDAGKKLPLPPNRELRPNCNGSVNSNADPGGRCVLNPGRSEMRCPGLVFPANLSHRHHRNSRLGSLDRLVHDFYYIDTKAPDLNSAGTSTCDWSLLLRNGQKRSRRTPGRQRVTKTSPARDAGGDAVSEGRPFFHNRQEKWAPRRVLALVPRLAFGVLLSLFDVFLQLLLLRVVRVLLQ
jgi:hypothetical protein